MLECQTWTMMVWRLGMNRNKINYLPTSSLPPLLNKHKEISYLHIWGAVYAIRILINNPLSIWSEVVLGLRNCCHCPALPSYCCCSHWPCWGLRRRVVKKPPVQSRVGCQFSVVSWSWRSEDVATNTVTVMTSCHTGTVTRVPTLWAHHSN